MENILVITGGSRGIGKAAIELYKANDWKVINISRTPCDIPGVENFNIDLSNPEWISKFQDDVKNTIISADKISLVHNASIFKHDEIMTLQPDSLRDVLEFSIVSAQALNTIIIPIMRAGSSIIYIGSTLSEMGVPGRASYVIAKHATIGMMRATCQDLRGKDITTCCICPGFVNTTMLTDQVDKKTLDALVKDKVSAGRLIEPEEIAELIYYCATHPVINGAVLHANLGQLTS